MPRRTYAERRDAGIDVMHTLRGGKVDAAAAAAATEERLGPLGSFVIDFALAEVWTRPGLSRRDRSLVVITILATLNQLNQLRAHVQGGINHGLQRTEIEEIFVQLAAYAGFPRAIDAMTTAHSAIAELLGVDRLDPSPAAVPQEDDKRNATVVEVMARFNENQPPAGLDVVAVDMGSFGGPAARFAFGEVWARPQLSRRDRSLVVCATLTTQDKPTELRFHLQTALNHGCTIAELEELMHTMVAYAGFPTAVQGYRALGELKARRAT